MPIVLKSAADIARMQASGDLLAQVHEHLATLIQPDITTAELDQVAREQIAAGGGTPSFLNYEGYPAALCTSINEQIIHGIPGPRVLAEGDVISLDLGVKLDGFHTDAARTYGVGEISHDVEQLIADTEAAFWAGFAALELDGHVGDAGAAVEEYAGSRGYGIVSDYAGHGVGRSIHEEPTVPNVGPAGQGSRLRIGLTFALEPMLTLGSPDTILLPDGWTVITADGSLAAHYEHTIAMTADGALILTNGPARVV